MNILTNGQQEYARINDKTNEITFSSNKIKQLMETKGIDIPAFMRDAFNGQSKVKLGEEKFTQAFKQIYVDNLNKMGNSYQWIPSNSK